MGAKCNFRTAVYKTDSDQLKTVLFDRAGVRSTSEYSFLEDVLYKSLNE